ncbi:MAG: DUF4278 domain-containing protein [Microcoleus sp. CSU_2_2]|nr:DUF4278 domain-containing protein [Microcoleus sp. SU_5_3]NJS11150.1 DUF4278 domain-containing protein [Microcoleus sp. CSU_2_2]
MKLTYRGANYEYDIPTVDMKEGEVAGKYRGQNWNYRYPRHIPVPKEGGARTYRSVRDTRDRDLKADETVAVAENTIEPGPAAVKSLTMEVAKVHRANICNILDRRKQVAAAKGDERLLRLLEIEWKQMAC